jgi:tRNA(His) 5'-end guanylyltransferase
MSTADSLPAYDARITPDTWTILRLDGRRFSAGSAPYRPTLEAIAREKTVAPFNPVFHAALRAATVALMGVVPADFAHTASDEISLVVPPHEQDFYAGRLAKWLSVAAGAASAVLARELPLFVGLPIMDARAFSAASLGEVEAYLRERIHSTWRNCRNAYIWHALATQGHAPREIERQVQQLGPEGVRRILADTPDPAAWERHGAFLIWVNESRTGRDPRTGIESSVERQVLRWLEIERLDADLGPILASRRMRMP